MKRIGVPSPVLDFLEDGAALAVSISGGKDSQALLSAVSRFHRARGFLGELLAVHADLGRAEWHQTPAEVERQAKLYGVPLAVVQRRKGDLFQRIEGRLQSVSTLDSSRPAKPFFPSARQRFCTSDLKRDPINIYLRKIQKAGKVVSAIGLRKEESRVRAKKADFEVNGRITTKSREALIWHPLLDWAAEDVWEEIGTSGADLEHRRRLYAEGNERKALEDWPAHPAYVLGNKRLSCALCVLACRSDLENGARHNPEALRFLVDLEERSGYTFRADMSLKELAAWKELHQPKGQLSLDFGAREQ